MIDWVLSLPPVPRLIIGGGGLLVAWLVLVEIGVAPVVGALIAYAWLTQQGWTVVPSVFVAVVAALLFYVVASVVKPNAPCWWCKGQPKRGMTPRGRWRGCLVCGGSGKRRPLGSKVLRRNRRFLGLGSGSN